MKDTVTIRLEESTIKTIKIKADKAQRTISDYLRLLIEEKI